MTISSMTKGQYGFSGLKQPRASLSSLLGIPSMNNRLLKGFAMTYDENGLFITDEHLETYAESVSKAMKLAGSTGGRAIAADIRRSLRQISQVHDAAELKWRGVPSMPGAVRWLLDNHYLVRREGLTACASFANSSSLRCCSDGPVLLVMCAAFTRSGRYEITPERLELFLRGFQRSLILSRDELTALEWGLRAVLVRQLAQLCPLLSGESIPSRLESDFEHIFTSLRLLSSCDLTPIIERADFIEQTLRRDPAGVYPLMDEDTRRSYRLKISRLAGKHGGSEYKLAQLVLSLARKGEGVRSHVGYWLFREPAGYRVHRRHGGLYIAGSLLLTIFFSLLAGFATKSTAAFFLLLIPVSELVKSLLDFILLRTVAPTHLPRMELKDGVPDSGRTLCVVSCLLTNKDDGPELARRLEEYRLCSRGCGKNLLFALLADLPDTKSEALPGGEECLAAAAEAVDRLNETYSGGFFLLTRPRAQSRDGRWMGWERKRGALLETMRYLRGESSRVECTAGDVKQLKDVHFLLTLDSDTRLTPESARELIGAMLHPLNRPAVDIKSKIVKSGHGVISPRMSVELSSAVKSDFSLIFAGQGGADPYSGACGEVYMDTWESGGFAGKGIIDIDAYLTCMSSRIPEGRVLSHDAIEGAFLRGGYMGSTELTDSFPSGPLSYYKRLHRWVRGDWQNLPWLFGRGRALPDIERFRLFDSLRRSLVPVMTFIAICAGFFTLHAGAVIAAVAALLSCACQLVITTAETLLLREEESGLRFHSRVYNGIGGGLVRTVLRLILLPVEAYFCLDAVIRALWRMLISKKNLLQWQTAGQSDGLCAGPLGLYAAMWPAAALGLAIALLSPAIIGKAAGIIWLLSPLCAYFLGVPRKKPGGIGVRDRAYLTECAKEIWGYFDEFMTEDDHFLPPDNYQAQPPVGLAHRTSPTNIGLALLSVMEALDLEFADKGRCMYLIDGCLSTLEGLEKWHGHLYNWYDTRTLQPLSPRYVSTVDSGNLYACLTALRTGLAEYGREDLAGRVSALMEPMDFSSLYDQRRRLFYIGIDADKGQPSESWYDLLSSEARLTGYIAIAKGDVPRRHWRRLSRAQVQKSGYRGMASWTGTAFEYLMPELLLPLYRDSLLYESARFCLYVQKRRTAGTSRPWGVSESAFYSLDPSMSYRYKAHGCAALALKPGMDAELVVSPYSSFLTLAVEVRSALNNLRRLDDAGMRGKYGFWEAIDYTPSRCRGKRGDIVRCVMSHHLGMSMTAITNCLTGGVMQRRFMADPRMRAYSILLQEKVPVGGVVIRRHTAEAHDRPVRGFDEDWVKTGSVSGLTRPECCLLSNQIYSVMLTDRGAVRSHWGAVSPYIPPDDVSSPGHGIDLFLEYSGESYSLLAPTVGDSARYAWEFTPETACLRSENSLFSSAVTVLLPRDDAGELRRVNIEFKSGDISSARLVFRFSPLLAGYNDYINHPAFYKLGLSMSVTDGCLVVRRLKRGSAPELYLCLACSMPCSFTSIPGLDTGRFSGQTPIGGDEIFPTEPLTSCAVELSVENGGSVECAFSLALAHNRDAAVESATRGLSLSGDDLGDLPRRAAAVMGMNQEDFQRAWSLLPELCFPTPPLENGTHCREELWKFGVSGDLPILCADCTELNQLDAARRLMDSHLLITGSGCDFDLVFITHDGASYRKPLNTALNELLWRNGGDALSGVRGGVHIVDDSGGADGLRSCACRIINLDNPWEPPAQESAPPPIPVSAPRHTASAAPEYQWDSENRFIFTCSPSLPPRAWANLLTNGRFGFLASECGGGNMWFLNSRENPISPWLCQPLAADGPEALYLSLGGRRFGLFAEPGGTPCRVGFDFGISTWEKRVSTGMVQTTAFIPPDTDARILLIRCTGLPADARLHWRLDLVMAPSLSDSRYTVTSQREGMLLARNDRAIAQALPFGAVTCPAFEGFTCSKAMALAESYDGSSGAQARPVFALTLPAAEEVVIVCGCDKAEKLRALTSPETAHKALEQTRLWWRKRTGLLKLSSPVPELDRLMNGWAFYQATACRVLGRCSIYQSGGAYGFRDQLQDTVNLIPFDPSLAREQILRSCCHQYLEGDVQHWWHEGDGEPKGVRTRCSDDLLWLPWALCEYVEKTGDGSIRTEEAGYLASPELREDERDRYESARAADLRESVLLHCKRALDMVLRRGTGTHGLLLIGSGDWNDGFDRVAGESQWLTWFFCHTVERFAALIEPDEPEAASRYREAAGELARAANAAWDGKWFLRGYYADGSPLGSTESRECRIDSIAQSFAAFCPQADKEKLRQALHSAVDKLFDRKNGLVRLFWPPFTGQGVDPGYIVSYGPGFRENGGQYTHGAIWLVTALLRTGQADEAWELLRAMLPAGKDVNAYKGEPFVIAADVYTAPGHVGEAGWTWYTGSAGWFLRTVTEEILGLHLRDGRLFIEPNLPTSWPGYEAVFHGRAISVDHGTITVDGQSYSGGGLELSPGKSGNN